jgi:DNA-binding transcriptional MerR regulator
MPQPRETLSKRYYTISEVASMFGVSTSLIRFWETEFEVLKPHKNAKGDRRFTPENIEQIRKVYHLVKERGFTLQGAKQELRQRQEEGKKKTDVLESLRNLRNQLENLKSQL